MLDSRPSTEFKYEAAKDKLVNLDIYGVAKMAFVTPADGVLGDIEYGQYRGNGRQGQLIKLAGCIDMDSVLTVCGFPSISHLRRILRTLINTTDWLCWSSSGLLVQAKKCRIHAQ